MSRNKAIWLARLLFRRGQLTKNEILEAWARSDEHARHMAPSTFYDNRHLLEERYGIKVKCESGYYRLDLHDMRERDLMKQLFVFDDGGSHGPQAIYIDEKLPAGYGHVATLAAAVEERHWVDITYEPFDKPHYRTRLAPYCLRTFRSRCYAMGFSTRHKEVRTFALDRMGGVNVTSETFRADPAFSARRYFANSFGAYGGTDVHPEHIVIEADTRAAAYLRTRPLHDTQREYANVTFPAPTHAATPSSNTGREERYRDIAVDGHDGQQGKNAFENGRPYKRSMDQCYLHNNNPYPFRFEIDVAISADLVHELLYYGHGIRIVAPQRLRELMRTEAESMAAQYGKH